MVGGLYLIRGHSYPANNSTEDYVQRDPRVYHNWPCNICLPCNINLICDMRVKSMRNLQINGLFVSLIRESLHPIG